MIIAMGVITTWLTIAYLLYTFTRVMYLMAPSDERVAKRERVLSRADWDAIGPLMFAGWPLLVPMLLIRRSFLHLVDFPATLAEQIVNAIVQRKKRKEESIASQAAEAKRRAEEKPVTDSYSYRQEK